MKLKFLITSCLLAISIQAYSQTPGVAYGHADVFTYDAMGNRIKREYKWAIVSPKNNYHDELPVDTLREASNDNRFAGKGILVKAYPNPVADEMIVENLSWKDGSSATVIISDIAGRRLQAKSFRTAKEQFSLSSFVPGSYTVSYYLDNHLYTTWKIIKK